MDNGQEEVDTTFDFDFDNICDINSPIALPTTIHTGLTPDDIQACTSVLNAVKAIPILNQPIYLRTNPVNQRSLLDLPIIQLYGDGALRIEFFYNQTYKHHLAAEQTALSSYLNLTGTQLLQKLNDSKKAAEDFLKKKFDFDIRSFLPLISNAFIEDRRTGLMFYGMKCFDGFNMRFQIPLYYFERNLNLTPGDRAQLENAQIPGVTAEDPTATGSSIALTTNAMDFARKHLIADELGFGDTRLQFDYNIVDTGLALCVTGLTLTIPTAIPFKSGLYGSSFTKERIVPDFNICQLITLATMEATETKVQQAEDVQTVADIVSEFGLAALDSFAANILQTPLGNGGHVGIGGFFEADFIFEPSRFFTQSGWSLRGWAEKQLSALESRFYRPILDTKLFNNRDFENPDQAEENMNLVNQRILDQLFPYVFCTEVDPGFITRVTIFNFYVWRCSWNFAWGYDFWYQSGEKLSHIDNPTQIPIDGCAALRPEALDGKLFVSIRYLKECGCYDIIAYLAGDASVVDQRFSVGDSYTARIGVEFVF